MWFCFISDGGFFVPPISETGNPQNAFPGTGGNRLAVDSQRRALPIAPKTPDVQALNGHGIFSRHDATRDLSAFGHSGFGLPLAAAEAFGAARVGSRMSVLAFQNSQPAPGKRRGWTSTCRADCHFSRTPMVIFILRIPTEFNQSAHGCEERATMGKRAPIPFNSERVASQQAPAKCLSVLLAENISFHCAKVSSHEPSPDFSCILICLLAANILADHSG
jgi:hypothetical protein